MLKSFTQTNCDAVKLESNGKNFKILKTLVKSGVKVMGYRLYSTIQKIFFSTRTQNKEK